MKELFEALLPIALQCEISVFQFWEMTYGELRATITAYNEREMSKLRRQASLDYQLANLIGVSVARLMDKNAKYPSIHEAYPSLFEPVTAKPQQVDWRIAKERLLRYTEAHNQKRGDKNI